MARMGLWLMHRGFIVLPVSGFLSAKHGPLCGRTKKNKYQTIIWLLVRGNLIK